MKARRDIDGTLAQAENIDGNIGRDSRGTPGYPGVSSANVFMKARKDIDGTLAQAENIDGTPQRNLETLT